LLSIEYFFEERFWLAIASQFWLSFFKKRQDYRLAAEDHCGDAKQEMKKQQCLKYNIK
jgi:hypothetical protein